MKHVTVATRGSALAVGQAEPMVRFLEARGYEVSWRKFSTSGDQWLQGPLDKQVGGGFFTKELEDAMGAGAADLLILSGQVGTKSSWLTAIQEVWGIDDSDDTAGDASDDITELGEA